MIQLLQNCDAATRRKIVNKKEQLMLQQGYPAFAFEIETHKSCETNDNTNSSNSGENRNKDKNKKNINHSNFDRCSIYVMDPSGENWNPCSLIASKYCSIESVREYTKEIQRNWHSIITNDKVLIFYDHFIN